MSLSLQTIDSYLGLAAASAILFTEETGRNRALNAGQFEGDQDLPFLLLELHDVVLWASRHYVGTKQLDLVANYMYALSSQVAGTAALIAGNVNDDIVTDDPNNNNNSTDLMPRKHVKLQFVVSNSAPMVADQTVLSITDDNIITDTVTVSADGVVVPENLTNIFSYTVQYNLNNIILTFNQGVAVGQVFIINYEKAITISGAVGS